MVFTFLLFNKQNNRTKLVHTWACWFVLQNYAFNLTLVEFILSVCAVKETFLKFPTYT